MSVPDIKKIVEAILFAADSSVPLDKLCDYIEEADRKTVRESLTSLAEQFDAEERPYALAEVAGGWQIYARPEYSKWIRELHKGRIPARLSQAALETLAIVAYKQPIVRAEIETIRGVDSSGVLATLMRRDLISIAGRAPGMGRALMYRTTKEFLRYFGLNFVTDLPRLEEFAEVLGLKPGEMELAVEGAESLSGVVDSGDVYAGQDGGEEDGVGRIDDAEDQAGESSDEDDRAGQSDDEQEHAGPTDDESGGSDPDIPPPTDEELGEVVHVSSEGRHAESPAPTELEGGGSTRFPAHGNTHAMDDKHLIDELDED